MKKVLLYIAHSPSPNTKLLQKGVKTGYARAETKNIDLVIRSPFKTDSKDVMKADLILLGTTENLGYMSGALKDFFDRIYYECLENTQGTPYAFYIRAGFDGTGARRAIASITKGLGWKLVQKPIIFQGEWNKSYVNDAENLGTALAAGLELGVL